MKRKLFALLAVLAMLCCMSATAFAHEIPDLTRAGSIEITMKHDGEAVPGGAMTIYRVGDITDDEWTGDFYWVLSEAFADSGVSLADLSDTTLPQTLADYVTEKSLTGTAGDLDDNGYVKFSDVVPGLYLVVQHKAAPGYNTAKPFLVSVPGMEDGKYVYDVDGSPKVDPVVPTTVPTETTLPDIPQTGQLNWPIPIMVVVGLCLFVLGWFLYLRKAGETDAK